MVTVQLRVPSSVTRALAQMLDEVIEQARVPPEHVVAEAAKRGLPMAGTSVRDRLESLRFCAPATLDPLAHQYVASSVLAAGVQGFVANLSGAAAPSLSISADTLGTLAAIVRATSGVMGSYGFESETEEGAAHLRIGLLAAAGVSIVTVEGTQVLVSRLSRQLFQRAAAERRNTALTGQISRRILAGALGQRLPRAMPVVASAIGAGVSAGLVRAVGGRARTYYRALLVEWQRNRGITPPLIWDIPAS
jgi:hypothetical protein